MQAQHRWMSRRRELGDPCVRRRLFVDMDEEMGDGRRELFPRKWRASEAQVLFQCSSILSREQMPEYPHVKRVAMRPWSRMAKALSDYGLAGKEEIHNECQASLLRPHREDTRRFPVNEFAAENDLRLLTILNRHGFCAAAVRECIESGLFAEGRDYRIVDCPYM